MCNVQLYLPSYLQACVYGLIYCEINCDFMFHYHSIKLSVGLNYTCSLYTLCSISYQFCSSISSQSKANWPKTSGLAVEIDLEDIWIIIR